MVYHDEALRMARSWAQFAKDGSKPNTQLYDAAHYDIIRIDAALCDLAGNTHLRRAQSALQSGSEVGGE